MNVASVPRDLTFWHPQASHLGHPDPCASQNQPLGTGFFHVKGSSPAGNSDVDATFKFWNIWHIIGGQPAEHADPAPSVGPRLGDLELPGSNSSSIPPVPSICSRPSARCRSTPNAHWLHITETAMFHLSGNDGSVFYATKLNTGDARRRARSGARQRRADRPRSPVARGQPHDSPAASGAA